MTNYHVYSCILKHMSKQLKTNAEIAQTIFLIQILIMLMPIKTLVQQKAYFDVNICLYSFLCWNIREVWNPLNLTHLFLLFFIMPSESLWNTSIKTMLESTRILIVPIWALFRVPASMSVYRVARFPRWSLEPLVTQEEIKERGNGTGCFLSMPK